MSMLICILALLCISASVTEGSLSAHTEENGELKKELEDLMSTHKQNQDANYMDNVQIMQEEPMYGDEQEDEPVYAFEEDDPIYGQDIAQEQSRWERRELNRHRYRLRSLNSQLKYLRKRQRKQATSVTYTRFGKSSCRRGAQLVYKGVVGGTYYSYRGGGSNYLCMPDRPEYAQYRSRVQGYSYLFGTEYEYPLRRTRHHDDNVPCAVCYVPNRSTSLMVPAKINCPSSFTLEYYGYLMSAHRSHQRTEFICVDYDQEAVHGSGRNTNGALVYHVEVHCHYGIHCAPYSSQKEVTCVVCSR